MNRVRRSIIAVVAGLAFAATAASAAPAKTTKAQSLTGTLQKVDGQTLTVQTSTGTETVMLAPNAKLHHGSKTLAVSDLASQTGAHIKVQYHTTNGHKEAQSVTVSSNRQARAGATGAKASSSKKS